MHRLTTDTPNSNVQTVLNLFYAKDREVWVRGGGPAPEFEDVPLYDYARHLIKTHIPNTHVPDDNDDLGAMLAEWLFDGTESSEGVIATLYTAAWALAEIRARLMAYEDTGLEPEKVEIMRETKADAQFMLTELCRFCDYDRLEELAKADKEGRLVVLPCKVGDTVYISGLKFAAQIDEIVINAMDGISLNWSGHGRGPEFTELWVDGWFIPEDIGKTVFLTREEAEAALKSQSGVELSEKTQSGRADNA